MTRDLSRLLRPKSIALFGGAWAENVIVQLRESGFTGDIWPVHPKRAEICGLPCYTDISELPAPPEASFIGVNRELTIEVVKALSEMGAGGATCFASGFLESEGEDAGGADLQAKLVDAAGDMPVIGPNCYGLINYLDNITLWPDQHGGRPCEKGVAIIGQSSNILINMTMQKRGLPLAYCLAAGNQAQTSLADLALATLADKRVTALGLYIEGFGNIREFEAMAAHARKLGKPIVAIKSGKSEKSAAATMSHTASLAGASAASSALMKSLGIVEVESIAVFLETLKLLHMFGPLTGDAVSSLSCSGGEAGLVSDMMAGSAINLRDLSATAHDKLKDILGPIVTVANPLDYHTFIWGEPDKLEATYSAVFEDGYDLNLLIMDIPPPPRTEMTAWQGPLGAAIKAAKKTGGKVALLATLPENLTEEISDRLMAEGIVPLHGMEEMVQAIDAAIRAGWISRQAHAPVMLAGTLPLIPPVGDILPRGEKANMATTLNEAQSKSLLAKHGLNLPKSATAETPEQIGKASASISFPVALKGLGVAHKSEAGAVMLNLQSPQEVADVAQSMNEVSGFLVEEMVTDAVAELIIGITRDTTGLYLLTIGAGGVLTELLEDTASLLVPTTEGDIRKALDTLKVSKVLYGYRGRPAADIDAIIKAVMTVQACCIATPQLLELDVNPLIALPNGAIAVDALIKLEDPA